MATAEGEHGSDFEETMFCEPCNRDGNTVEADGFCSDCSDYLCSTCLKYHKRLAKNHNLLDKSNMPQDFCFERCSVHPNVLVKFYCHRCDDTACPECLSSSHQAECSDFKHIPSYMQSRDVYNEFKDVRKSLKYVEEEASRMEEETGEQLEQATLNSNDISKSINHQKKYVKDRIEDQRIELFKALEEERAEVIRNLDERQDRRKQYMFEQQKLINRKIDDQARILDERSKLYPKTVQNIASKSANIRSKLESITTELEMKERQGRKAELFMTTRRVKHNMNMLQKDIDDVREHNAARCFSFRPNTEDISIDAAENASLGSLIEQNQQRDTDGIANDMQRACISRSATDDVTEVVTPMDVDEAGTEMSFWIASALNTGTVEKAEREVTSEKTLTKEPENVSFVKTSDKKRGQHAQGKTVDFDPEFANPLVATAVKSARQAYITAKQVYKTWQDKQKEAEQQGMAATAKTQTKSRKAIGTRYTSPTEYDFNQPLLAYSLQPKARWPNSEWSLTDETDFKTPINRRVYEPEPPKDQWKPPAEIGPMARLLEMGFRDKDLNKKLLKKHNDNLENVVQEIMNMKNKDRFILKKY